MPKEWTIIQFWNSSRTEIYNLNLSMSFKYSRWIERYLTKNGKTFKTVSDNKEFCKMPIFIQLYNQSRT